MNEKELKNLIIKIFINFKLSRKHSVVCANAIINAELVGAPSHGLSRLKMYCERTVSYTHLTLPTMELV